MNELSPIGRTPPALGRAAASRGAGAAGRAPAAGAGNDSVELSVTAKLLSKMSSVPDTRSDLVSRVRAEIAAGTYETPEKIEATVDALLDELV